MSRARRCGSATLESIGATRTPSAVPALSLASQKAGPDALGRTGRYPPRGSPRLGKDAPAPSHEHTTFDARRTAGWGTSLGALKVEPNTPSGPDPYPVTDRGSCTSKHQGRPEGNTPQRQRQHNEEHERGHNHPENRPRQVGNLVGIPRVSIEPDQREDGRERQRDENRTEKRRAACDLARQGDDHPRQKRLEDDVHVATLRPTLTRDARARVVRARAAQMEPAGPLALDRSRVPGARLRGRPLGRTRAGERRSERGLSTVRGSVFRCPRPGDSPGSEVPPPGAGECEHGAKDRDWGD